MMTNVRYLFLALAIIISLHYILSFSHEAYGRATSISNIKDHITGSQNRIPPYKIPIPEEYYAHPDAANSHGRKANAAIVMLGTTAHISFSCESTENWLARNGDLNGVISSMKQMEDRFNKKFHYPYVFLNEEPFNDGFKTSVPILLWRRCANNFILF